MDLPFWIHLCIVCGVVMCTNASSFIVSFGLALSFFLTLFLEASIEAFVSIGVIVATGQMAELVAWNK